MSRAFVKEPDGSEPPEDLPDRGIPEHRNFVTQRGLELINAEIGRLLEVESSPLNKRDLNYWLARRASAELVPPPENNQIVQFGHKVTIRFEKGSEVRYQITGQDEADPIKGLLSYVSPLAANLLGKAVGDIIEIGPREAEIINIS